MNHNVTRWNVHIISHNVINCAMTVMPDTKAIYFASDSNEGGQYLLHESPWSTFNATLLANATLTEAEIRQRIPKIVSRPDVDQEPVHFDSKSRGKSDPSQMYPTFVDLWIIGHAKCVSHGLGGYPRLAAALTGNYDTCRAKAWLMKGGAIQYCPEYLNQFGMGLEKRLVIPC
jgi:hypothetical protein